MRLPRYRTLYRALLAGALLIACAGAPPPPARGVLENDVSTWKFRRYQELLDVEVWVEKNAAVAHTASYVREQAEKNGRIADGDVVNAFVTRYAQDAGVVRALILFVRRLAQDSGYAVEELKQGGVRLFVVSGTDEAWVLWAAERHVVKLGGRGLKDVPVALIKAYGARYPSRLADGMLEGPLPPVSEEPAADKETYDPENPRPDWDKYKPGPTKQRGK